MDREIVSDALLLCATLLIMVLYIPQIAKTARTKNVAAFSMKTVVMRALSNMFVIAYGALQGLPVIIASASVVVIAEMVMISLTLAYRI